ncbi:MAG: asparagine--tRNA ligase [Candidatus Eisenbacteria bacterium]|nr:asparagine--tRNA ligase [Candidatus Eisenbacteria bacterium]
MSEVRVAEVQRFVGQEVRLRGWVTHVRSSGKLVFIDLRDGTGRIQGVASKADVAPEIFAVAAGLSIEESVELEGLIREDPRSPGGCEMTIHRVKRIGDSPDYPITPKEHGPAFLLDRRHLWLRSSRPHAILSIRNEFLKACRDFFYDRGFVLIDAPIFTPAAVEGTTTLFETQYFDEKAYLTQSGQLYMEAAAMAFGRVYCLGPTFRAEKSKTRRHLIEFWMLEPEVAFADLDAVLDLQEEMIVYLVSRILDSCRAHLAVLGRDTTPLEKVQRPFPRVSYDDAVGILNAEGHPFEWGGDLGAADETLLCAKSDCPVFVHRFPTAVKPFYMKTDPCNPRLSLSADLLAPEGYGEIIGGGQREDSLEILERRIEEQRLPRGHYEWYLDLRRYGSVPHAGFGMGIERTLTWICGIDHLREAIPFPRMLYRLYP